MFFVCSGEGTPPETVAASEMCQMCVVGMSQQANWLPLYFIYKYDGKIYTACMVFSCEGEMKCLRK